MEKIQSRYLHRDFVFTPATMQRDDGPVTIIPHNELCDIINNQLDDIKIACRYDPVSITKDHCFIGCTITDESGRSITEFGESTADTLTTKIAKSIPATIAQIRAFDRTAIRYLDFSCDGKVYSDQEIPSSEYDKPEKKTKSEKKPDNTNNSVQLSPDISSVIATNSEINEEATVQNKQDTAVEDVTESILKQDSVPIVKEGNITLPPMPPEDEKLEKAPTPMQKDNVKKTVLDAFAKHSEVIFFDTETSGFKPKDDRILELAAKKYAIESGQLGKQLDELHVYIKPPFSIRQEITDINGISDEFLTDKPIEEDAFIDIFNFFGENPQIIVAHNTVFDNNFMSALYERQEKKFDPVCKLDTLDMAHEQLLNLDNYKLETVASHLGIQGEGYHTAVFDTDRLVDVFVQLYKKYIENNINETEPANGSTSGKLNPKIISLSLFDKSEKLRRIYVNTDKGTLYYDLVNKSWASKDAKIDSINMEYLEKEAWKHAGAENQTAFEKFKGSYSAAA